MNREKILSYFEKNIKKELGPVYNIEMDEHFTDDKHLVISIGKIYNECEYDRVKDKIEDVIAKWNLRAKNNIYATTSIITSEKYVYIGFFKLKDIPHTDINSIIYQIEQIRINEPLFKFALRLFVESNKSQPLIIKAIEKIIEKNDVKFA